MSSSATGTRKLPQEEQRTIDDPFAFRIYAAAVFAVALGLLAWGAFIERGTVAGYGWRLLPWIVGALIVDLASLTTASRAKVQLSFSYPLLLAAAFIYDPTSSALVAIAGSMDPRELRHEVSILHGLFNRSQIALCVMSASAVFHALGGANLRWPTVLWLAIVAVAADMVVNALLVGMAVRLQRYVSLSDLASALVMGRPGYFLVTFGLYGLSAVIFRELFLLYGYWSFALFAIPIVLGHEVFTHGERLSRAAQELEEKGRALEGVTQTIAAERRDERVKVAASLHDEVLQQLHHVHLMGEVLRHDLASGRLLDLEHDLPELLTATEGAADSIRSVIRDLRSSSIGRGGLTPTVGLLIQDLGSKTETTIKADLADVGGSSQIQLLVYQVAREALQNAVNHSGARQIQVRLHRVGPTIHLEVVDDGCGFAPATVDRKQHFGLQLMEERLQMVGGRLVIDTSPGAGTRIFAEFPREVRL